jgi:hypothetical protein
MTYPKLRETYARLWGTAEGDGAFVTYEGTAPHGTEAGWFHPTDAGGDPKIVVVRPYYMHHTMPHWERSDGVAVDIEAEFCVLAHEYGHMVSWRAGNRTAEYVTAAEAVNARERGKPLALDGKARALVFDEEERAWKNGRKVLRSYDWTPWERFNAEEKKALDVYREILAQP